MKYGRILCVRKTWETMHTLVMKMLETAVQCLMEHLSQTPLWGRPLGLVEVKTAMQRLQDLEKARRIWSVPQNALASKVHWTPHLD